MGLSFRSPAFAACVDSAEVDNPSGSLAVGAVIAPDSGATPAPSASLGLVRRRFRLLGGSHIGSSFRSRGHRGPEAGAGVRCGARRRRGPLARVATIGPGRDDARGRGKPRLMGDHPSWGSLERKRPPARLCGAVIAARESQNGTGEEWGGFHADRLTGWPFSKSFRVNVPSTTGNPPPFDPPVNST